MKYSVQVLTIGSYPEIKIDQASKYLYESLAIEENMSYFFQTILI